MLLFKVQKGKFIVSLMAYTGANGSRFKPNPLGRLTTPDAIDSITAGCDMAIHREDFIPVPMPNPICAAIGYFFVDQEGVIPMIRAAGVVHTIACIQNQHFAQADEKMEAFFREMINNIYANPQDFAGFQWDAASAANLRGATFPGGGTACSGTKGSG